MARYRIARPTSNLEKTIDFYTKALNLTIIHQFQDHDGYDGVMLGLPDESYHLEFIFHPKFTQEETQAPSTENLLVFYFDSLLAFKKAISRIEKYGAKEVSPSNPYWKDKSKTYEDPEGWRIVFFEPK
ncbi:MAG: VOC family protein [Bacteroidota bacterium]